MTATNDKELRMPSIPFYLRTSHDMERPTDMTYYVLAQDGLYIGRSNPFFTSEVPARSMPPGLVHNESRCQLKYPRIPRALFECIVGFFGRIHELHGSEAIVLVLWDTIRKRYKLLVPEQEATVWVSDAGRRVPEDVFYTLPLSLPAKHLIVGDFHSHGNLSAYTSYQDEKDELHRDGFHGVVGRIDLEPPELHLEFAVDGARFSVRFDDLVEDYGRRRQCAPRQWLEKVKVRQLGPGKLDSTGRLS